MRALADVPGARAIELLGEVGVPDPQLRVTSWSAPNCRAASSTGS